MPRDDGGGTPSPSPPLAVLHITPLRASRPLALRFLSQRLALPLNRVVVMALAAEAVGSTGGSSSSSRSLELVPGFFCSDTQDLVGGMQQARPPGSEPPLVRGALHAA